MKELVNNIETMIYEIRGKYVMLDSDLAKLYGVEAKRINEAVYRNPDKFPERFCFLLNDNETEELEVAICDLKKRHGGRRYKYRVFSEQGVAMLATILKSKIATQVSINIMDAFVAMRKYIGTNLIDQKYINNQVMKNTEDIKMLQESFSKFEEKKVVNEIYFNGQIYDAYSKIVDILKEAKEELIIIDAYADKTTLDIVRELKIPVTLIINDRSKITKLDIEKYNEQYQNLKITHDNTFHDRYFILDKEVVYHCGTSINDAGSKTFSINRIDDEIVINSIVNNLKEKDIL